jgi:hypothetical protein
MRFWLEKAALFISVQSSIGNESNSFYQLDDSYLFRGSFISTLLVYPLLMPEGLIFENRMTACAFIPSYPVVV